MLNVDVEWLPGLDYSNAGVKIMLWKEKSHYNP